MDALLKQLDAIEKEMQAIEYWTDRALPPDEQKTFEHWLQFSFLPAARTRIASNDIPKKSQVGLMALREYDYHSHVPEAQRLLSLLNEFDAIVEGRK